MLSITVKSDRIAMLTFRSVSFLQLPTNCLNKLEGHRSGAPPSVPFQIDVCLINHNGIFRNWDVFGSRGLYLRAQGQCIPLADSCASEKIGAEHPMTDPMSIGPHVAHSSDEKPIR